jgi:hypothetical protein
MAFRRLIDRHDETKRDIWVRAWGETFQATCGYCKVRIRKGAPRWTNNWGKRRCGFCADDRNRATLSPAEARLARRYGTR